MAFNVIHNPVTYTSNVAIPTLANTGAVYVTANGRSSVFDANGYLGIGTSSPNRLLTVDGGTSDAYLKLNTSSTGGSIASGILFNNPSNSDGNIMIRVIANSNNMTFWTGGAQSMTLDSSGNLLVGSTVNPNGNRAFFYGGSNTVIRVADGINTNWRGYVIGATSGDATEYGFLKLNANSGELQLYVGPNTYGGFQTFYTNGSERMRLDTNGNLGLGVTPSAWTSGNKGFDIGTYTGIIDGSGGAGGPGILGNAYEYSSNNFKYKQNYYATLYRSNYSGQHQWFVAPSGTAANTISFTQAMTLDNSGHLLIGDTNNYAGSTLYVNNSISTNYSGSVSMRYNSSGASTNYWKGITGTQIGLSQTARGLAIFNYDADSNQGITFYPAAYPGMNSPPSPSMTLDSSGNLGIGTTTTTFRLNVSGRSTFIPSSENYAIYMAYNSSTAGVWLGSPAANVQAFYDYVGNERMRLDTSGNLLVNYDSSSFSYHTGKLSVFTGTGGADELYFIGDKASQSQNSNSPRINLVGRYQTAGVGIQAVNTQGYGGKDLVISMHNSSDYTTYYEAMRLTSSGRLGIGTSSPASSLDINVGTVGSGNTLTALTLRSADLVSANQGYGVGVNFYSGSELTAQIIAQNSSVRSGSGQLSFYTNSGSTATSMNEVWRSVAAGYTGQGYQAWYYSSSGSTTEAMRIDSSGRLGIGTTSPTAPLEMVGSANNTIVASNAILKVRDAGGDGIAVGALLSSPYQVYIQAGYLGNGYSPAFNGGYSLLLNPVGGNVGIGTTSPSYPLHVSGSSYLNGRVLIGSAVGYCFWSGNFINQGSYVHFKLNQTANSSTMFNIEGIGYDYGSSQTIGCMWCGYCYSGSNTVINTGTSNYGSAAGVANNIYTSSDGYAVIVAYVPQQYFFQIELNQITIGEGFRDIQVLTYAVANSNSGVF
jgi:hypothetical protein